MNEQNKNGKHGDLPDGKVGYVDRSEKVKNFKVHFDEEPIIGTPQSHSDKSSRTGTVYVGDRKPSGSAQNVPPPPVGIPNTGHSARPINSSGTKRKTQAQKGGRPASAQTHSAGANAGKAVKPTKKKLSKNAKRTKRKYSAATWITLAVIIFFTVTLSYFATSTIDDILNINKSDEPVEVVIPENATTDDIIYILHDAGLIDRPKMCSTFYDVYLKLRKKDAPEYASGSFDLKASMGLEGMLNELHVNTGEDTIKILFQEGWSTYKIFSKLEEKGVCGADYLYAALDKANFNFDFVKDLSSADSDSRYLLLEGYLFPDTYEFYANTNASAVIELFLQNFKEKWTKEYKQRADELGYSLDEIITIASIIQREAGNKSQMADVASVIYNRLDNELSYPTLGCDSTADYITVDVKESRGEDVANAYLPYYDTAVCTGLPAGPVCNPGIDAIEAALYPATTDYFYFLHDSTGGIHLSKTFDEHQANINEYIN